MNTSRDIFFHPTNDGFFIGTSISFKKITEKVRFRDKNNYDLETYKDKFTVIPVGLQLGVRTNGTDLSTDFFVGMMINANSGTANERSHSVSTNYIEYPDVNQVNFQFGIIINACRRRRCLAVD